MKHAIRAIENIVEFSGRTVRWFSVALILVVSYEVLMRYAFTQPSMWPYDLSCMLGASLAVIALSYAHLYRRHVKVDILYNRLSDRGKSIIEVIGHLIFFLPFAILLSVVSVKWAVESIISGEVMTLTGWYPPMAPLRVVMAVGFILLLLQGSIHFFRDAYFLTKGRRYD